MTDSTSARIAALIVSGRLGHAFTTAARPSRRLRREPRLWGRRVGPGHPETDVVGAHGRLHRVATGRAHERCSVIE